MLQSFYKMFAGFYLVFTAYGLVLFTQAKAEVPYTTDFSQLRTGEQAYAKGYQVRASSWDWFNQHHVMYAIDGEDSPSTLEKWASAPTDREPWIETRLPEVTHEMTIRSYEIECRGPHDETQKTLTVRDNTSDVAVHLLNCKQAQSVRVHFHVSETPEDLRGVARLYEMAIVANE
jgi:hypothetical protein